MSGNREDHYYVDEDGNILHGVEKISTVPIFEIGGKPIGEVDVYDCTTMTDLHFRVFQVLWDYHRQRNFSVDSIAAHLRVSFPGFPKTVEAFLISKTKEEPPR